MAVQNLRLRGGSYWWRRKISVSGVSIPIALSLRTGILNEARGIQAQLSSQLEFLRVSYGERGSAVDAATLKKIFNDAMRWQLNRILSDQRGSTAPVAGHRAVNMAHAEFWRLLAKGAKWTAEDDERLEADGWPPQARMIVADLWEEGRHKQHVSRRQIDAYLDRFQVAETQSNVAKMQQVIFAARAAACDEATKQLGLDASDYSAWIEGALADTAQFAFEPSVAAGERNQGHEQPAPPPSSKPTPHAAQKPRSRRAAKPLLDAAEDCIADYTKANGWSTNTCGQVRTAIRLFDFAAGGDIMIEDLTQAHVSKFKDLCSKLPNRWGRTVDRRGKGTPVAG